MPHLGSNDYNPPHDDAIGSSPAPSPLPVTPEASAAPAPAPAVPAAVLPVQNIPAPIVPATAPQAAKPPVKKPPPSKDVLSKFKNKNEPEEEARMGFIDHLMELRKRLWISIIAVFVCVTLSLIFYKPVYAFLCEPVRGVDRKYSELLIKEGKLPPGGHIVDLTAVTPFGSMIMVIWVGIWAGLIIASPIVFYELWAFVAPGLHDHEKRAIKPILYGGVFFFLAGAAAAYFFLAPMTFDFFLWLDIDLGIKPNWTAEASIDLLITMMLISGLLCEIPLIVAGLSHMSVVEPWSLVRHWRVCTFSSIALGMIVSPGNDLASMSAFSGLILGIYMVSIVMAFIFYKKPYVPGDGDKKNGKNNAVKKT